MAQLGQRHAFCRRRINELSSPTARIPPEILIEIFQIACQPVDDDFRARQATTPLFIGSICRFWRDVAWSTPFLWSTVFLHVSRKHHATQIQLLEDWLLNAKSAPLSIKITSEGQLKFVLCAFEEIMRILFNRSDYWLTFNSCFLHSKFRNILKKTSFPMLTSISLRSSAAEMFLNAPKLVNVTLLGHSFPPILPWGQLRTFRTGKMPVNECLKVLRKSPSLNECHFEGVYTQDGIISKTILSHAQLKHLHTTLDDYWATSLFDGITLPSLSGLHIQYDHDHDKWLPLSSITSLVLRSACNLERLTIKFRFNNVDLIPCLEVIPSLT